MINLNHKHVIANEILTASCIIGKSNEERAEIAHILFIYYGWKVKTQGAVIYVYGVDKWLCRYWNLEGAKGQLPLTEHSNKYPITIENCKLNVRA